jgi:hypothetical protein
MRYEGEDAGALASARQAACRFLLSLRLVFGEGSVRAEWLIVDSALAAEKARGSFEKPLPSASELQSSFWSDMVVDLESAAATTLPTIRLLVRGRPGTDFDGAGQRQRIPSGGLLEIGFDSPALVIWTASSPGNFPERGRIAVEAGKDTLLTIPRHDWSVELGIYGFAFPELRANLALGDYGFVRLGITEFLAGLDLSGTVSGGELRLTSSYPLVIPSLGAGLAILPPVSEFRPYVALDLFARMGFLSLERPYLDPVAPGGLDVALGFDWGAGRTFRVWMEVGCAFYPWARVADFRASAGGRSSRLYFSGTSLFPGHPGWIGEFPLPKAGIKVNF